MKFGILILACLLVLAVSSRAAAQEKSDDRDILFEGDRRYPNPEKELEKSKYSLQDKWGNILLVSGFAVALAGAFLVEGDSWGYAGKVGFVAVGAGIGISVTGMFLLSFPLSRHRYKPRRL